MPQVNGYDLLFGEAPGASKPQMAPPANPKVDGMELLFGRSPPQSVIPQTEPEPKQQGWGEWLVESVKGKHDPKYEGIPTVLQQHKDVIETPMVLSSILGGSDEQMGDIIQKALGDRFIRREKDANGYDVFVTRGPNGEEQRGYMNAPGLDAQDVGRGVWGSLPYIGGGIAMKAAGSALGLGTLGNMGLQALGAGTTSVAGDIGQIPLGSEQGVDPLKAGAATVLAGLGEAAIPAASAVWRRFVTEPKYFNRATGELTALGKQEAVKMGLDPATMASDVQKTFAKTYAASPGDAQKAITAVADREFGIPSTIGQRLKDPEQLMKEKGMRSGLYGLPAKETIKGLDEQQLAGIERSIQSTIPEQLTGKPVSGLPTPAEAGENIRTGLETARGKAKALERAAWPSDDITPTMDAIPLLGPAVKNRLGEFAQVFTPDNTPTAWRMGGMLNDYIQGKAPSNELQKAFGLQTNNGIDAMRKSLGLMIKDAQTPTDKAAASAIYNAYDDWMQQAAQQGMLSGDVAAVAAFRTARDISKEMNGIFSPRVGAKPTPGAKLIEQIKLNDDTPEKVVSTLFSGPKAEIKAGAVEALQNIKHGFERYMDPAAATAAWNDIRLAHWAKTTMGANGEVLGAQALRENLKHALNKQGSLMRTLYDESEINQIRRLVNVLERVTYKDPNPSGTATGVAVFAKQFVGKILDALPFGRVAWEYSGVPRAMGAVAARRAVQQEVAKAPIPRGYGFVLPAITQADRSED